MVPCNAPWNTRPFHGTGRCSTARVHRVTRCSMETAVPSCNTPWNTRPFHGTGRRFTAPVHRVTRCSMETAVPSCSTPWNTHPFHRGGRRSTVPVHRVTRCSMETAALSCNAPWNTPAFHGTTHRPIAHVPRSTPHSMETPTDTRATRQMLDAALHTVSAGIHAARPSRLLTSSLAFARSLSKRSSADIASRRRSSPAALSFRSTYGFRSANSLVSS